MPAAAKGGNAGTGAAGAAEEVQRPPVPAAGGDSKRSSRSRSRNAAAEPAATGNGWCQRRWGGPSPASPSRRWRLNQRCGTRAEQPDAAGGADACKQRRRHAAATVGERGSAGLERRDGRLDLSTPVSSRHGFHYVIEVADSIVMPVRIEEADDGMYNLDIDDERYALGHAGRGEGTQRAMTDFAASRALSRERDSSDG